MILDAEIPVSDIVSLITSSQEQSSLLCYNLQSSCLFGVFKQDDYIFELSGSSQTSFTLLVANSEKQLRIWKSDGEILKEKTPESCQVAILDLSSRGDRWEGVVSDNNPFGYGILYNEKGSIVYEGYLFEGRYCCYGTTYYCDIEKVSYLGQFCDGKRHGYGQSFSRNDEMDYQGQWYVGLTEGNLASSYLLCSNESNYSIQSEYAYDMQVSKLPFKYIPNVQSISIGAKCFTNLLCLEIVNLPHLQTLYIGRESFMIRKGRSIEGTKECVIRNCPQLQSIKMEDDALCNCDTFKICELDRLDSVVFGMNCFWKCSVFELCDLPSLKQADFGVSCFSNCRYVLFSNLPTLRSLSFSRLAFYGDLNDECKEKPQWPFNYRNSVVMKDLPELTDFHIEHLCFHNFGHLHMISYIPKAMPDYGSTSFECVYDSIFQNGR